MRCILFVDDEPLVLHGLRNILRSQRHHWDMVFVTTAEAALQRLEQSPVDIVVTDMRMPGMDGVGLLRHVRAHFPHVRCLALSGYADFSAQEEARNMVHRFLVKPCDPALLRQSIEEALGAGQGAGGGAPEGRLS